MAYHVEKRIPYYAGEVITLYWDGEHFTTSWRARLLFESKKEAQRVAKGIEQAQAVEDREA
jgi:hypothetical protein